MMKNQPTKYTAKCDIDDIIQCGRLGLFKCMNLYDVKHKSKANFNTYAHWYISGEIMNYIRMHGSVVRIPNKK